MKLTSLNGFTRLGWSSIRSIALIGIGAFALTASAQTWAASATGICSQVVVAPIGITQTSKLVLGAKAQPATWMIQGEAHRAFEVIVPDGFKAFGPSLLGQEGKQELSVGATQNVIPSTHSLTVTVVY